jgi:hypothetical protein
MSCAESFFGIFWEDRFSHFRRFVTFSHGSLYRLDYTHFWTSFFRTEHTLWVSITFVLFVGKELFFCFLSKKKELPVLVLLSSRIAIHFATTWRASGLDPVDRWSTSAMISQPPFSVTYVLVRKRDRKDKIKKNEIEYSHSYQSKRLGSGDYPYDPTLISD